MKDFVVNIIAKCDGFDLNIKKSKREINAFKDTASQVVGTLGKVGGVLGLATGASELFSQAINSSAITQNAFNDSVNSAKTCVDNFFRSLSTGDWSYWTNGIGNAIQLAKNASRAIRDLQDNLLLGDISLSEHELKLDDYDNKINDPNRGAKDKKNDKIAFDTEYNNTITELKQLSLSTKKDLGSFLRAKGINTDGIDLKKLAFKYLPTYTDKGKQTTEYSSTISNYNKRIEDLQLASATSAALDTGAKNKRTDKETDKIQSFKNAKQELINSYSAEERKYMQAANAIRNLSKEDRTSVVENINTLIGLQSRDKTLTAQKNSLDRDFDRNGNYIAGVKITPNNFTQTKVTPKQNTGLDFSKYNNNLKVTDMQLPMNWSLKFKDTTLGDLKKQEYDLINQLNNSSSHDEYVEILAKLDFNKQQQERITTDLNKKYFNGNIKGNKQDHNIIPNLDDHKKYKFEGIQEGITAFRELASAISEANTENIALQKGMVIASTAASIAQMIAIMVEKSKKSLTIWDWIAGITAGTATVVAMSAQLKSLSAFADGGIVSGNKTVGDMNLVRVNSGEMILNQTQQGRLFNMINHGALTDNTMQNGKVEFKIEGKQLVGVLNNYTKKINKVM